MLYRLVFKRPEVRVPGEPASADLVWARHLGRKLLGCFGGVTPPWHWQMSLVRPRFQTVSEAGNREVLVLSPSVVEDRFGYMVRKLSWK